MDHRFIKLLTFNVRSLVDTSRQIDLKDILHRNKIDIGFIQECHLKRNKRARIDGYNFIYDSSPIGVAIVMKNTIQYNRIFLDDIGLNLSLAQIEFMNDGARKRYLIGSIYVQCNYPPHKFEADLAKLLQLCGNFDGFILGGDLNSRSPVWGDNMENINGKSLRGWLEDNSLEVDRLCDAEPSYPNGPSFLDHFLMSPHLLNRTLPNFEISTLPTFSDHFPIKLSLRIDHPELILRTPRTYISYKDTNWPNFIQDMDSASRRIMPISSFNLEDNEIDEMIDQFKTSFNCIHNAHTRQILTQGDKFPLSEKTKKLYKIKHSWQKELKKIFHRTGNRLSSEYNVLSKQIQLLKTIIKESVNMEQADYFNKRLQDIKPGPSAFKKVYQITGKSKSPFCQQIVRNNSILTNSTDIANEFHAFYSDTFRTRLPLHPVEDLQSKVSNCLNAVPRHIYNFDYEINAARNQDNLHFTTPERVKDIVQRMNNKKSSGLDGISNFVLKRLPESTLNLLTFIFNNCINNGYFPSDWKVAKILPIKKKTECATPSDFRPISLLSNIGKIFEHILKEKIENDYIIEPLPDFQFGFRKTHSTQHALLKFHSDITINLRDQSCTVAISLDIEKAFDSVIHTGILYKLIELETDPYLVKILHSFFSNRRFCVDVQGTLSNFGSVGSGVPQGSVLAPHLFNIFLHDFPHTSQDSQAILYADDCLIYAHDKSPEIAMEKAAVHLRRIDEYYKTWGIKINEAKSRAVCVRNASGKCPNYVVPQSKRLELTLNGVSIPVESKVKYLGVTFDKLLKFNPHARGSLQKSKKILGSFSYLFNSKYLPQSTKLLLYKVAIRPVLIYGFPIWFTISPTVAKEMEILERKVLRKCINKHYQSRTKKYSNSYIYDISDIEPLCSYGFKLLEIFVKKMATHENDLIRDIYELEERSSWVDSAYLSPVAIINETFDNESAPSMLPEFFRKTTPGSHRG